MSIIKKILCKIRGCPSEPPVVEVWSTRRGERKTIYRCRECSEPVGVKKRG